MWKNKNPLKLKKVPPKAGPPLTKTNWIYVKIYLQPWSPLLTKIIGRCIQFFSFYLRKRFSSWMACKLKFIDLNSAFYYSVIPNTTISLRILSTLEPSLGEYKMASTPLWMKWKKIYCKWRRTHASSTSPVHKFTKTPKRWKKSSLVKKSK